MAHARLARRRSALHHDRSARAAGADVAGGARLERGARIEHALRVRLVPLVDGGLVSLLNPLAMVFKMDQLAAALALEFALVARTSAAAGGGRHRCRGADRRRRARRGLLLDA